MAKGAGARDQIVASAQRHYYRYCGFTDWQSLRVRTELTFAGTETNGVILPADLIGIMAVQCETDLGRDVYNPGQEQMRYMRDGRPRWFFKENAPEQSVVVDGNFDVDTGTSAWIGDDIPGAVDDDYIQIHDSPGFYKITDASDHTFTPTYRGPRLAGKGCTLRPPGTRRLQVVDRSGALAAGTIAVYFWAYPEPLYEDWQRLMLPNERAIELEVLIEMLGTNKNRQREVDGYRTELPLARESMIDLNPKFLPPPIQTGRTGRGMYFGRQAMPRIPGRW